MYASDFKFFHLLRKHKIFCLNANYAYSKRNVIILKNVKFGFLCSKFYILNVRTRSLTFIFIYIIHFRYFFKSLGLGGRGLII